MERKHNNFIQMKLIRITCQILDKSLFYLFDTIYDFIFDTIRNDNTSNMYCTNNYKITSGGVIVRTDTRSPSQ
jgi:hypothetical protein